MSKTTYRKTSLFPQTLAQCIEPVTRPVLKSQGLAGSRIITQWAAIVGPMLAQHSQPEKLFFPAGKKTGGTLTIATESGFAPEIQHQIPVIMERLSVYFGYRAVSRITISHSYAPSRSTPVKTAKKPAALPADISALAADIADDELRAALESLAGTLSGKAT